MTFSRIGLWAFDLCQLKELQLALATHPRRNSLCVHASDDVRGISLIHSNRTALQYSLQNVADMLKVQFPLTLHVRQRMGTDSTLQYILTIVLSRPSQFKYAALASFISVCAGAFTYLLYVKRERGHLLHHSLEDIIPLLKRRTQ